MSLNARMVGYVIVGVDTPYSGKICRSAQVASESSFRGFQFCLRIFFVQVNKAHEVSPHGMQLPDFIKP